MTVKGDILAASYGGNDNIHPFVVPLFHHHHHPPVFVVTASVLYHTDFSQAVTMEQRNGQQNAMVDGARNGRQPFFEGAPKTGRVNRTTTNAPTSNLPMVIVIVVDGICS